MKNHSRYELLYRFLDFFILIYIVFDVGFNVHESYNNLKLYTLLGTSITLFAFNLYKYIRYKEYLLRKIVLFNMVLIGAVLLISFHLFIQNFYESATTILHKIRGVLQSGLIVYFIVRLMVLVRSIYKIYNNPVVIFAGSFLIFILLGAFLLMLPNATYNYISFTDALFSATSAVCVTGIMVLNTSTDFTPFGQLILLLLIQIGGLGILTFTSFFAFFFKGGSSFKEGLNVSNFLTHDNIRDVLKFATNIVLFTIFIEALGALMIYISIADVHQIKDKVFFSIFHSVSAFCNAGFSTLENGLTDYQLSMNYGMLWVLMVLIVLGGLGYNIIFNTFQLIRYRFIELFKASATRKKVRVMTLNSKLVLYTTAFLLFFGFVVLFITEWNNTLLAHTTWFGKFTIGAFNSVIPRTAGFHVLGYEYYTYSSLFIIMFLMWVGASPASTGGGIKTTTFALAVLNVFAIARGRNRIQIMDRRISSESTSRAFAILYLSLLIIGIAVVFILMIEPVGTNPFDVIFECFGAYTTAGMSTGFSQTMSEPSKYVLMATMFVGRIGMLNLLIGMLKNVQHQFYEYPKENVLIN